jgi:type I restriction enzyme R subunit
MGSQYGSIALDLGGSRHSERYFREDPAISLFKLRQFAELLSKIIAARHALYRDERETFEETLRKLSYARVMPKETADVFHFLRKVGPSAARRPSGFI